MIVEPDAGDAELAESADGVAALYGLGEPSGPFRPAARGEQGLIWRLDTSAGSYAVKVLVMRRTEDEVARSVAFQERAASQAVSYDVAPTLRTVDGRVLSVVADRQIQVSGWLEMSAADPGLDPRLVGQMLAELHSAGDARPDAVDPWYVEEVGERRWHEYIEVLTSKAREVATRLEIVVPDLIALEGLLTPPGDVRTCHRDLWADNVRMTTSGRLCVFDWDNCGPADVNHELAMLLWEYGLDDAGRIRLLYDTYVDAGGPGRIHGPGDLTMVIAQFGHFYELAVAPFLDLTATRQDRDHGIARFDEFDSRPLTMESIAQIVAACAT